MPRPRKKASRQHPQQSPLRPAPTIGPTAKPRSASAAITSPGPRASASTDLNDKPFPDTPLERQARRQLRLAEVLVELVALRVGPRASDVGALVRRQDQRLVDDLV